MDKEKYTERIRTFLNFKLAGINFSKLDIRLVEYKDSPYVEAFVPSFFGHYDRRHIKGALMREMPDKFIQIRC